MSDTKAWKVDKEYSLQVYDAAVAKLNNSHTAEKLVEGVKYHKDFIQTILYRIEKIGGRDHMDSSMLRIYDGMIEWRRGYDSQNGQNVPISPAPPVFKKGDTVRISRAPTPEEREEWPYWAEGMGVFIGKSGVVSKEVYRQEQIYVGELPKLPRHACTTWFFPHFLLEKITSVSDVSTPKLEKKIYQFKEGDTVEVVRSPTIAERVSWPIWNPVMDAFVGKTGKVSYVTPDSKNIRVRGLPVLPKQPKGFREWTFPDFVLRKVEEANAPQEVIPTATSTSTSGETTMNSNDLNILKHLAGNAPTDDLSRYTTPLADGTDEAMKELLAEEAKEAAKVQARVLLNLARTANTRMGNLVEQLRVTRATEKRQLEDIKAFERASDYAIATKNYLPLLFKLDGYVDGVSDKDCKVPEDWKKPE